MPFWLLPVGIVLMFLLLGLIVAWEQKSKDEKIKQLKREVEIQKEKSQQFYAVVHRVLWGYVQVGHLSCEIDNLYSNDTAIRENAERLIVKYSKEWSTKLNESFEFYQLIIKDLLVKHRNIQFLDPVDDEELNRIFNLIKNFWFHGPEEPQKRQEIYDRMNRLFS